MFRNVLLTLTLLAVTACTNETSSEYLTSAEGAIEKGDYKSATIELKNALRLEPDSARGRWLLGKVYFDTADFPSAEKELQRALTLGWPAEDIQPLLAAAKLTQGEFNEVRQINGSGLPPEAQATLYASQAHAALNMGDTWDAETLVEKALAQNPDSVEAAMAKARVLVIKEDIEGANAVLDRVIELDPSHAPAWSLRGNLLSRAKDYTRALAAYDQAIKLQPKNFGDRFERALLQLQLGDYEKAQRDAAAMRGMSPKHPAGNYIQGLLHFQAENYKDAIASLSLTEPAYKEYPLSMFYLASANLKEGNLDLATSQAERFHSLVPSNIQGRELLAALRLQEGNYGSVVALLRPVLASSPDNINALNLTTNALLRQGKTDEGIELLSKAAALQPESPGAQIRLGAGLLIGGKTDESVAQMQLALELDPEFELADVLIVSTHLQKGEFPAAIEAAQAYRSRHPESVTPYNLLAKVYQLAGEQELANEAIARSIALDAADPAANHYLAEKAIERDDIAGARNYYQTVLAKYPKSVATLIQLAMLASREGDQEAQAAHLQQAVTAEPAALPPRLLLARLYLGQGKPEQVAPLFVSLDEQQQQDPDVLQVLAMAQLSSNDPKAAQFTLEQLLKIAPDSAPIRHVMAMAVAATGDDQRAVIELHRALELDENYLLSRLALARMALRQQSTAEFQEHLAVLTAQAPENSDVLLLQAANERLQGNMDAAVLFAKKAYERAPSSGTLISLGSHEEAAGNQEDVVALYSQWLEAHPEDNAVRMALASTLLTGKQENRASEQYLTVLQSEPDNLAALNNLAWIEREKKPIQALEYARKAAALAPQSGEVLDTLALIEYINKDYRRAERSIERALELIPDNPTVQYHSAMIAVAVDNKAAARETLKKLVDENVEFPESAEAQALLQSLDN